MGVNSKVFGSIPERRAFQKLSRTWGDKYRIYHNLPFLQVLNTDGLADYHGDLRPFTVSPTDRARLKKTSIDFTLCNEMDTPLLCIEFDGLKKGFNVGAVYTSKVNGKVGPGWRKTITELKLKVAHGSGFPYLVVGSQFFEDISSKVQVTVVDGIIGDILANKETHEVITKGFSPEAVGFSDEEFGGLSKSAQHDIVQNWVIEVETEAEMQHNPICSLAAELSMKIGEGGFYQEFLFHPPIPNNLSMAERVGLVNSSLLNGARCTVTDRKGRKFTGEAWIPNFKSPGFSGYGILMDLAHLFALDKAFRMKRQ